MSSRKTIVYTRRPEPILFEGFVGQKTSMRQWKRRYFVLFKSCIVAYAAKPPAGKPLEVFPLTTYHYISQLKGKEECRFDLLVSSATSRHTCEYLAATGEGARLWVAFIKQAAQDYQAVKPDFDTSGKFWKNPVVLAQCVPANTFRPRTEDYLISGLLQRRGEAAPTSGRASVFRTAKPKSTDNWVFISSGKGNRPAGIGVSSKKTVEAELFIPATAIKSFTAFGLGPYGFDIVFKQEAGDEVTLSLTTKTEQDCEAWCVALEKVTGFSATETSPRSIESPSLAIRSSSSGNSPPRESFPKKIGQKTIGFSGHWFRLKDTAGSQPGSTRTSPSVSVSANSQSPSPADSPWATLSASGRRLGVDEVEGVEEDRLDVMLAQLLQDEKHGDTARRQVAINAIGGFLIQGGADPDSLAQGANAELAKEKVSSTVWAEIRKEMHRIKQEKEKFAASAASQPRPSPPSPFLPPPALLITGSEFGGPALPLTPGGGLLSPRDSAREHRVERMSPRDHLDAQDKDHRLSLSRRLSRSVSQQMARRSTSMASQAATQSPAAGGKMGPGALSLTVPGAAGAVSSSSSSLAAAAGAASPSLSSSSSSSSSSSAAAAGAASPCSAADKAANNASSSAAAANNTTATTTATPTTTTAAAATMPEQTSTLEPADSTATTTATSAAAAATTAKAETATTTTTATIIQLSAVETATTATPGAAVAAEAAPTATTAAANSTSAAASSTDSVADTAAAAIDTTASPSPPSPDATAAAEALPPPSTTTPTPTNVTTSTTTPTPSTPSLASATTPTTTTAPSDPTTATADAAPTPTANTAATSDAAAAAGSPISAAAPADTPSVPSDTASTITINPIDTTISTPTISVTAPTTTDATPSAPATPAAASVPPSPRSAGLPADVKLDADGYPWYEDINTGVVQAGGEQAPFATYAALSLKGQIPGTAKPNQDRAIHLPGFAGNPAAALFGVFDGHGPTGHLVSAFVIKEFPKLFEQELLKRAENETIAQCASAAFRQCNTNLFKTTIDIEYSGSTGIVIYLDGAQLWCFNVGDSRAILAQRSGDNFSAAALSRDHKPDDAEERKRIEGCGGRCEPKMTIRGPVGTARVWLKDQNIPGLAVARAFGDKIASTIGVIADPEIKTTTLKDGEDAMIILASDGIWEFMDNLDVVAWAAEAEDAAIACKDLVEQSCWIWEEEDEARDDITVITIFLRGHVPLPRQDYSQDYQDAPAEGYSADAAAEE